jgi:hypothetical protein
MKRRPSRWNKKLLIPHTTKSIAYANEAADLLTPLSDDLPKRISNAPPLELGISIGYYGYTYATAKMRLSKAADATLCCLDTRCSASLIDRKFLLTQDPNVKIQTMAKPLTMRGIAENAHSTKDYAIVTIRIPGVDTEIGEPAEAVVTWELHIVDDLCTNILVGMDIITSENMDLEIFVKSLKIGLYNVKANI